MTTDELIDGWPDEGFLDRLREIAAEIGANCPTAQVHSGSGAADG